VADSPTAPGFTAAVLRAAAEAGIKRVVLSSSGSVYPLAGAKGERFRADRDLPAPANLYGITKLSSELVDRGMMMAGRGPLLANKATKESCFTRESARFRMARLSLNGGCFILEYRSAIRSPI